jgi:6-phosphofructokinase 1
MIEEEVLKNPGSYDFRIDTLGKCSVESPIHSDTIFVDDDSRVLMCCDAKLINNYIKESVTPPSFEVAGPRKKIFHDPAWSRAAICTCGGLCPGLNDVIKAIVQILHFDYKVKNIYGIRYGYRGFIPEYEHSPMLLTPEIVDDIHEQGGTILGSSRGQQSTEKIVDTLLRMNINMVFCVGGDGTLRAANEMSEEIKARGKTISVIGIPKTIDNDLNFVGRSFGFETAVYEASKFISLAHNEAKGALNGVGLVKLMGRDSGFIAAYTSLANSLVNICLIPELSFTLEGKNGLFKAIERRFAMGKDHLVLVVAEGAGQDLIKDEEQEIDASGNILKKDIGTFLEDKIDKHFKKIKMECDVKYFDPSYAIRSIPARGTDAILCYLLAVNAAHAAMAGKTNCVIGQQGKKFVHVPIALATKERQKLDIHSSVWKGVLDATRQNDYFYGK